MRFVVSSTLARLVNMCNGIDNSSKKQCVIVTKCDWASRVRCMLKSEIHDNVM